MYFCDLNPMTFKLHNGWKKWNKKDCQSQDQYRGVWEERIVFKETIFVIITINTQTFYFPFSKILMQA